MTPSFISTDKTLKLSSTLQVITLGGIIALLSITGTGCKTSKFAVDPVFAMGGSQEFSASAKFDTAYIYSETDPAYENYLKLVNSNKISPRPYYLNAYVGAQGDDKKRVRNEIVYEIMAIIDEAHAYNFDKIRMARGNAKFGSKLIGVGTHIATAASPGAEAVNVLAAIGAGASSLDESINSAYLHDTTLKAIFASIEGEKLRLKALLKIDLKRDTTDYPLQAGLADMKRYWQTGFIHTGVALLEQAAAQKVINGKQGENKGAANDGEKAETASDGEVKTDNKAAETLKATTKSD